MLYINLNNITSTFKLQVLYHLHKTLGDTRTLDVFKSSGEFMQTWCHAHAQEKVILYSGKTAVQEKAPSDGNPEKTNKVWTSSNPVTELRQTVHQIQLFTK